ncbi:hypothetical protein [Mycolicibacterium sp. CBMA 226]|uniref:hypothetical protein n=1 Tax=Mycolicibacterium sp. CBMA 226 TaxID=2606611 RepID=UPI0012DBD8C2|nr:hypothetical protein [Mycolicibacterium sp. CBMA 226]MUL76446.1 hypothetical protein [Mycolicibacterium sp. CBMA 226]
MRSPGITAWMTAAASLAVAAVGFAAPAAADPAGAYTVHWADTPTLTQWTFTPCGSGCSHVTGAGWSTDAQLINSRWVMGTIRHTAYCVDGSPKTDTSDTSFDAVTLNGVAITTSSPACADQPPNAMPMKFYLTPAN